MNREEEIKRLKAEIAERKLSLKELEDVFIRCDGAEFEQTPSWMHVRLRETWPKGDEYRSKRNRIITVHNKKEVLEAIDHHVSALLALKERIEKEVKDF